MKQQSKKIVEDLLSALAQGAVEYKIIKENLARVLFIESVSESNKFNMYAYCFKDDLLPYHNGVYHDAKRRYAVFTDGQILFYSRKYYDENFAGECVTKYGILIKNCCYPNWFYVIDTWKAAKGYHLHKIDFNTIDKAYEDSKIWVSINHPTASKKEKELHTLINIDGNYFTIAKIRKISLAMRDFGLEELAVSEDLEAGNPAVCIGNDSGVIVMPVVHTDYEDDKSYYVVTL